MDVALALNDISLSKFDNKLIRLINDISHYRGGDSYYGSCEWADLREHIDIKNSTSDNLIHINKLFLFFNPF